MHRVDSAEVVIGFPCDREGSDPPKARDQMGYLKGSSIGSLIEAGFTKGWSGLRVIRGVGGTTVGEIWGRVGVVVGELFGGHLLIVLGRVLCLVSVSFGFFF